MRNMIRHFLQKESSSGLILISVTLIALLLQNSFLSSFYNAFLSFPLHFSVGSLSVDKPLLFWVNDGLMTLFFVLVGLEIKREILEGELSSKEQIMLPLFAALGGMILPAFIFCAFNYSNTLALKGWAIPMATDIAFALGILSLLGNRIPLSLKIFLMALAIIDDLGAIVIIALFYTQKLSFIALFCAGINSAILLLMNYWGVRKKSAYIFVGFLLWVSVLASGIHATIAGVIFALTIPLFSRNTNPQSSSLLKEMEYSLHPWVAYFILPLFAFMNAGVSVEGLSFSLLFSDISLGVFLGLFLGKQVGVFCFSMLAIRWGFASLPTQSSVQQLYGVSILTGIGFTMSLFIDSLAFADPTLFAYADKLAILLGSFTSGIVGYFFLRSGTSKEV